MIINKSYLDKIDITILKCCKNIIIINDLPISKEINSYNIFNITDYTKNILTDNIEIFNTLNYTTNIHNLYNDIDKLLTIYVYYNRINENFNETSLSIFLREAVLKDEYNDYLLILNTETEINLPIKKI